MENVNEKRRIKSIMVLNGISVAQIAEHLHRPKPTIYNWLQLSKPWQVATLETAIAEIVTTEREEA